MIFVDLNLDHLTLSNGHISYINPNVKIGVDVDDNVDIEKLRTFKDKLQLYIDRGLNECLIDNKNQQREEL